MLKDKVLMITGGTGSFGNTVLNRFLDTDIRQIIIFSRDFETRKYDSLSAMFGATNQSLRQCVVLISYFTQPRSNRYLLVSFIQWKLSGRM